MYINERLRALRKEHRLSQAVVADMLQIHPRTYSDYETGQARIPVDRLMILARYYDCCLDYITCASNLLHPYPQR